MPRRDDTDEFASTTRTQLIHGLALCDAPTTDLAAALADRGCAVLDAGLRAWYGFQLVKARRDRGFWAQSGGYLPDGSDYGQGTSVYWLQSHLATHNAGHHIAEYAPWVRHNLLAKVIYPLTPTRHGYYTQGDVEDFSYNYDLEPSSFQLEDADAALVALHGILLEAAGDTVTAAWGRGLIDDLFALDHGAGAAAVWRLGFEHDALPGTDYRDSDTLPSAFWDSGLGLLYDRSAWDAQASLLTFRAGWSGVDHSHQDLGHFQLFRAGQWITHEAIAYDGPAALAEGHNVLLLQQADNEGEPDCVCQRLGRGAAPSRIIRVSSGASHTLATADLLGCYRSFYYHSEYYDAVQRSVLWRKTDGAGSSDLVIVYDLVDNAADAPAALERGFSLQLDAAPLITGQRATVQLPAPTGAPTGSLDQRLDIAVLLPAAATTATATLAHGAPQGQPDDYPGQLYNHRLLVAAPDDEPALRMVTVLRAADETPPALQATPVQSPDAVGVLLEGELVLFPRASQSWTPGGLSRASIDVTLDVTTDLPLVVWWAGFVPGQAYDITVTESGGVVTLGVTPGTAYTADSAGLLVFGSDDEG